MIIKSEAPLRLGIVGLGMGMNHAERILSGEVEGVSLAAVADLSEERLASLEGPARFQSAEAMFESGQIDAALIATPHATHVPLAMKAVDAGLHILVEKPLALNKVECELLVEHAYRTGVQFSVMHNQRTDPRFAKLRELITSGALGRLQRYHWTITNWFRTQVYYDAAEWRGTWVGEGGGLLVNQLPHQLDMLNWLFGLPDAVSAVAGFGKHHVIEVEDEVTAFLEYGNGITGVLFSSTGEWPGSNRLEVVGEMGRIVLEGRQLSWSRNLSSSAEWSRQSAEKFRGPQVEEEVFEFENGGPQHAGILENFAASIRGEKTLLSPGIAGSKQVELSNALLLAALERSRVALPLDSKRFEETYRLLRMKKEVSHVG